MATSGVAESLPTDFVAHCLSRHLQGDWGDLDSEDTAANDDALASGEARLFSSYELPPEIADRVGEKKVWIITEWDRSVTTVLFPSEY